MCSVGPNQIYFWDIAGNKKKGIFGTQPQTNLVCVAYDEQGFAYTGG
jgi:hypothetical protein